MSIDNTFIHLEKEYTPVDNTIVSVVTIRSSIIDDWLIGQIDKVTLTIVKNCCDNPIVKVLSIGDITDNYLLYDIIESGVYGFKLEGRYIDGNIAIIENCIFIDIDVLCRIITKLNECECTDIHLLYYLLDKGNVCDCACDYLCNIYQNILTALDTPCEKQTCLDCGECQGKIEAKCSTC